MSIYEILSTILTISMLSFGVCFFITYITPSFKKSPFCDEIEFDLNQYLKAKVHNLNKFGFTNHHWIDSPLNGVTYECSNQTVVIIKLKYDRKCTGFIINDTPIYLDLSAHCEINLREGDTFCLHTQFDIEYYKVFERVELS